MQNPIKVILAILFFGCLLDLPYGYYELVRFLALVGFGLLAYKSYEEDKQTETIVFVCLAVLFQPLLKISLGRDLWNFVDVIVGIGLLVSIFTTSKDNNKPPGNT